MVIISTIIPCVILQKHIPCWEILLVFLAFFHFSTTRSGIMNAPEMEGNFTGVPPQVGMNEMKNGGFAQILVCVTFLLFVL